MKKALLVLAAGLMLGALAAQAILFLSGQSLIQSSPRTLDAGFIAARAAGPTSSVSGSRSYAAMSRTLRPNGFQIFRPCAPRGSIRWIRCVTSDAAGRGGGGHGSPAARYAWD